MAHKPHNAEIDIPTQDCRYSSPYRLTTNGVYEGELFYPNSADKLESYMVERMMPLQAQLEYLSHAYAALMICWPEMSDVLLKMIDDRQHMVDQLNSRLQRIQESRQCVMSETFDSKLISNGVKKGMGKMELPKVKMGFVLLPKHGDVVEDLHDFEMNLRRGGYIGMAEGFPLSKVLGYRTVNDVTLERVQWTGKLSELHELMRWLIDDVKLITCPGGTDNRWEVTGDCFLFKNDRRINIRSLSTSSGINYADTDRLHKCLPRTLLPNGKG